MSLRELARQLGISPPAVGYPAKIKTYCCWEQENVQGNSG